MVVPAVQRERGLVSAVVAAYNHPVFLPRALESVLAQTYENVEAVVCNDGSTDDTGAIAEAYAARHPGRIRVVHQANGGLAAAVSGAIAAARGEVIAVLDADDEWLPHKVERTVALLEEQPDVVLVHADQRLVDADGKTLHRSYFESVRSDPARGRPFGTELLRNTVGATSVVFRAEPLAPYLPIPTHWPYADWYLGLVASLAGRVEVILDQLTLYRSHGGNMNISLDDPAVRLREDRRQLLCQRLALGLNRPGMLSRDEAIAAVRHLELTARRIVEVAGTVFAEVTEVLPEERTKATERLAEAKTLLAGGEGEAAAVAALHAIALDPFHHEARTVLAAALPSLPERGISRDERPSLPAGIAAEGSFVTATAAQDAIADPGLLAAYAAAFGADDDATLVIAGAATAEVEAAARAAAPYFDRNGAADAVVSLLADEDNYKLGCAAGAILGRSLPAPAARPRLDGSGVARLRELRPAA